MQAEKSAPDEAGIITLQAMKTGALIRYACEAGAIVADASASDRERLAEASANIGLAFQLADDLLDVDRDAETMGKATRKDAARGKATLVALHGAVWARSNSTALSRRRMHCSNPLASAPPMLKAAATFIAEEELRP